LDQRLWSATFVNTCRALVALIYRWSALVEAWGQLDLAEQQCLWLPLVRRHPIDLPVLAELFHERERSSLVGPANGLGNGERAQLGNRLTHDAFVRVDERRLIRRVRDRLDLVAESGLGR
jgi:hypothetical protein